MTPHLDANPSQYYANKYSRIQCDNKPTMANRLQR